MSGCKGLLFHWSAQLSLKVPEGQIDKFANRVEPDEVAHYYEPPHLDLHCLASSL